MKQHIIDKIKEYDTIILHRHVRPDPDAYGSQGGLAEIIKATFPEKTVYTVGQEEPTLYFMKRLDQIDDSVYEQALVIICDTANQARICDQRYKLGKEIIKIDHHPNEDPYGDLLWVDVDAAACSQMIYELFKTSDGQLKMNDAAARLLYAGIVSDTGRFLYSSTTIETMQYAGELMQYSFDRQQLFNDLYEKDAHVLKLEGYILQHFKMDDSGVAEVRLTEELLQTFNATQAETSLLVSILGSVKGIRSWVFFIEEKDQIRVRFRSKGPVINGLAMKYNGGGHPMAAGASVYSWEEADQVLADLKALVVEQQ
ncbi:DHH family phosphoesterase [Domibacillus enclensis]|uniref:DHH family phosphoesterase n=1 Tax=Domibacillus enclensis TaxID=1017273 RepID=A0A1N6Q8B4_9BACI|nr:bifunctional oligoribonuclease/PAP phosphatase NrnA [Domibacillus enclensis]OXS80617.1 DHH family phosphoesterase [Domibacillus enclensis]SIQ12779.1 phosphoesterase RecJ domain-containing protein [Domibacillus enclensis]